VAVAPLLLRQYPSKGPGFGCLRYFGADRNLTEIRGPLCRPEHEGIVVDTLLDHSFARDRGFDCFIVDGVRAEETALRMKRLYGSPLWTEELPNFVLDLPKTWEEFRRTRSRNIKESLRKCENSPKRAGLELDFRVASSGAELSLALESFFSLHAARASRTDTVRHKNVFADPLANRFLRALVSRYESTGGVRIFTLVLDQKPVAARIAFRAGRSLYLYYSGYDPAYGQYSVMTTVVARAIRYAIEQGYESVNLLTGNDLSKTRWSPTEKTYRQAIFPSTAPSARWATTAYLGLRKRWLRRLAQ
jgi:CelD/BcsL family acetyltransferase involved in cellulose biosynthesis